MKRQEEFIHPYRQNRRCFNRYFSNSFYLKVSVGKNNERKQPGDFLDNVSRTSSIKIRQNPFQNELICQNQIKQEAQDMRFIKSNRRNISILQNPQIYQLISKHVQKNQLINKNFKEISARKSQSQHSTKYKGKSFSIDQFKKTPKITEFTRQTFHRKLSSTRSSFSSKKQKQDNLHSSNNLDINSQKISLCKRTQPYRQRNTFVTCQVYMIKKRVGIDASILTGTSKQIKFRLIMNQSDTKTFQLYWNADPQQFIEKCLTITEHGIKLKLGVFNVHKQQDLKLSPLKQYKKTYLRNYESFVKSKIKQKNTPIRVGNIVFCQQYKSQTKNINQQKINHVKNQNIQKIKINSFQLQQEKKQEEEKKFQQIIKQKDFYQNLALQSLEQVNQSLRFNNSSLKQIIQENPSKVIDFKEDIQNQSK